VEEQVSRLHYLDPYPLAKKVVLLLHGLGADGSSWMLQMPALGEAGYRPIALDTMGFGESPYDGKGWSIRKAACLTAETLRTLGNGPADVVGLSMGGVIAQQFALDFPDLVRKLVLVSTFSVLRPEDLKGWWYFLRRAAVVISRGKDEQAQIVAKHIFPRQNDQVMRDMYISSVRNSDPGAYRMAMVSLGRFDSRKRLKNMHIPTLVITGEEDTTVSPSRQKRMADGIEGACQVIIKGAGHAVSVDQAETFNETLLEFLRD
jgi:3-oxoadipate enol-lactonase